MKKHTIILIFFTLFCGFTYAQPRTGNKHIHIKMIIKNQKQLYKKDNSTSIQNNNIYLKDKKGKINISITANEYYNFIFQKDTMRLKVQYKIRDNLELEIKNLNFLKGNYDIDLYNYVKEKTKNMPEIELPFVIENFPNDCLN